MVAILEAHYTGFAIAAIQFPLQNFEKWQVIIGGIWRHIFPMPPPAFLQALFPKTAGQRRKMTLKDASHIRQFSFY